MLRARQNDRPFRHRRPPIDGSLGGLPPSIEVCAPSRLSDRLRFFDFASQRSSTVATGLGTVIFGLSAPRDGRTVFYSRLDSSIDELMVVEDFR